MMGFLLKGNMKLEKLYEIYLQCGNVSTDTRSLQPGDLFFALKGPQFDANTLALDAIKKGATAAVVDDQTLPEHPQLLKVENSLKTLQDLGKFHRQQMNATVIGITGSNGKTTTKELISCVLHRKYRTIATQGNLNNHIGVPLTLLRLKPDTEFAVVEMGANHIGEIAQLCRLALPHYGIITNIGKAHLEGFGGLTGVINAKSELYAFIDDYGKMLFVNKNNNLLDRLSARISRFTYGSDLHNDLYGELIATEPWLQVAWEYKHNQMLTATRMIGAYNTENILAAISIGCFFNVPAELISEAIATYESKNNRSQLIETDKNRIIMDAYNANPGSMEASIRNFNQLRNRKSIAILGDMLELGEDSDHEHAMILKLLIDLEFEKVMLVGPLFANVYRGDDWLLFSNSDELVSYLQSNPLKGYDILVKGSRGMQLEKVLPLL